MTSSPTTPSPQPRATSTNSGSNVRLSSPMSGPVILRSPSLVFLAESVYCVSCRRRRRMAFEWEELPNDTTSLILTHLGKSLLGYRGPPGKFPNLSDSRDGHAHILKRACMNKSFATSLQPILDIHSTPWKEGPRQAPRCGRVEVRTWTTYCGGQWQDYVRPLLVPVHASVPWMRVQEWNSLRLSQSSLLSATAAHADRPVARTRAAMEGT